LFVTSFLAGYFVHPASCHYLSSDRVIFLSESFWNPWTEFRKVSCSLLKFRTMCSANSDYNRFSWRALCSGYLHILRYKSCGPFGTLQQPGDSSTMQALLLWHKDIKAQRKKRITADTSNRYQDRHGSGVKSSFKMQNIFWILHCPPILTPWKNLMFFWPCIMNWLYIDYQLNAPIIIYS